jgi:Gpi18-like mannosyltransferase
VVDTHTRSFVKSANLPPSITVPRAGNRWIAVFLTAWLVSAAISLRLIFLPGYAGDVSHYKYWTRVVTTEGIQEIYHGEYPETYAIYPPVTLYAYGLVGHLYQRFAVNPWATERMLASEGLTSAVKGVSVAFHLALGATIFALLYRLYGARAGALGSAAYLLNPAVIFDSAYWGQPDAAHTLFAVLALGLSLLGLWPGSWVAAGLAAMTKPQAWALVPLYVIVQFRVTGIRRVAIGIGLAMVTMLIVVAPFVIHGRVRDFLTLPQQIAGVMPVASANAHNLWWIVTNNPAPVVLDSERILGPLTYRLAALPLVLLVAGVTLWRLIVSPGTSIFLLAAYQAFGWFCFTTQAHENHSFFVLPLLIMAAPVSVAARVLTLLVSCTLLANMILHDPAIIDRAATVLSDASRHRLQIVNSWANLAILGGWTAVLFLAPRWCDDPTVPLAPRRAGIGGRP